MKRACARITHIDADRLGTIRQERFGGHIVVVTVMSCEWVWRKERDGRHGFINIRG